MKLELYRALTRGLSRCLLGGRSPVPELSAPQGRRLWFHGASRGEIESLLPVIRSCRAHGVETVVTSFSKNGMSPLMDPGSLWTGLVRGEGFWAADLDRIRPTHFVTFRYEAWPELWVALRERGIPIVVFGARNRRSYSVARKAAQVLSGGLPEILFATSVETDLEALRREWPSTPSVWVGEPRWDQVRGRAAQATIESSAEAKLGICGSVWPEDVPILEAALRSNQAIWLFPHETHAASIDRIGRRIQRVLPSLKNDLSRWSEGRETRIKIVDRQGFLVEAYGRALWAYVGGGFGRGLHSVLEPAFYRIPIACGPRGVDRFPEAAGLVSQAQLQVVHSAEEFQKFFESSALRSRDLAPTWEKWIQQQFGATERAAMLLCPHD